MSRLLFRLFLIALVMLGQFGSAQALAPDNDDFVDAAPIATLPLSATADVGEATLEPEEPQTCLPADRTVWYTFIPSETMIMIADARGGSGPKISIYRATGPGFANLEYVQCVSPGGAITFQVEAGQTYYIQVGAVVGAPGTVEFSLSEVVYISGYVIDAVTGEPLPGNVPPIATVTLLRVCGLECLEPIRTVVTFDDGRFLMDSYFGDQIEPGTYMLEVSASGYQTTQFGPFEFTGANLEVGDLAINPAVALGSIQGRLLDAATGKPISQTFAPSVNLYRCMNGNCFEFVSSQTVDSQGRFRFESDSAGNPLLIGTYQVVASIDQYHPAQTDPFAVDEGEHLNVGSLRVQSYPVRFSDVVTCGDMPPSGGVCAFSVRIWNGLGSRLRGATWSLVGTSLPDSSINFSEFQAREPKKLNLERGESRIFGFRFQVPPSQGSNPIGICTRVYVGQGENSFFNTVGFRDLFCFLRNADGYGIAPRAVSAQAHETAATGAEVEPNNSCQTAQDLGEVTLPFTLDGALDSSQAPDIDFYRFQGAPGAAVMIDHEGESTGKGTLVDPLLGAFDSNCNLIAADDDSVGLNPRLILSIPEDGVLILAATSFGDSDFLGGEGEGTYQLTISQFPAVGSISGRVTDALTGAPLPGDAPPFAFVDLLRCEDLDCFFVSSQNTASDGSFSFTSDANGLPLPPGSYFVTSVADQYQGNTTETFEVGEGEHVDVGTLALTPFSVVFSEVRSCALPSQGGLCQVSVKATNTLSTRIAGRAWSMVYGFGIGSFIDSTAFQTDEPVFVKLDPSKSQTLRFRFRLPGSVSDGAFVCAVAMMGQNPSPFFAPVGRSILFCLVKGDGGFTLMSTQEAQSALQQMRLMESGRTPFVSEKQKK